MVSSNQKCLAVETNLFSFRIQSSKCWEQHRSLARATVGDDWTGYAIVCKPNFKQTSGEFIAHVLPISVLKMEQFVHTSYCNDLIMTVSDPEFDLNNSNTKITDLDGCMLIHEIAVVIRLLKWKWFHVVISYSRCDVRISKFCNRLLHNEIIASRVATWIGMEWNNWSGPCVAQLIICSNQIELYANLFQIFGVNKSHRDEIRRQCAHEKKILMYEILFPFRSRRMWIEVHPRN